MKLTISQIDKVLFSGEAESITVPGAGGVMTILSHHTPLISMLKGGEITVRTAGNSPTQFPVSSGFLEVGKNEATVLI